MLKNFSGLVAGLVTMALLVSVAALALKFAIFSVGLLIH